MYPMQHGNTSPVTLKAKNKKRRPRNTWRRDLDADAKQMGQSWGQLERLVQNRDTWRKLVGGTTCEDEMR
ncbi:hypothetical protein DPMN_150674 [Dreissena polymorpha]|uniref:Uncharacterized protein n=1 Tax=Dreissena polymorpha TaxID=45954 RepID=A0A9D4FG53_DREPO|nr:hypothetical protein DPMN_150674 [Dreissena polymorpha]